jgi:predicted transcriptional regulator
MMNISFFLTPKSQVVWVSATSTLAQAIEHMRPSGYSAVPLLHDDGGYAGTLTEGEILRHFLDAGTEWECLARTMPVGLLDRLADHRAVHIDAEIETLLACVFDQNFVPVVDDREVFIGIVRRRRIMEHCARIAGLLEASAWPPIARSTSIGERSRSGTIRRAVDPRERERRRRGVR